MSEIVELSSLDLRYEGYRLRDPAGEVRLLASIRERGIEQPLQGVDPPAGRLLLNGFKRQRAAKKLGIAVVPYVSLGEEEVAGILSLMQVSTAKTLATLEQARFLADLLSIHGMSVAEVAQTLSRSKGWVCMRQRLLEEMGSAVEEALFGGRLPVYSYMYTLRPFMRMNAAGKETIERFVKAVAGHPASGCPGGRLSVRDIELLAQAYFRGPDCLRQAIEEGRLGWSLQQMKDVPQDREGCSPRERGLLTDLEGLRKCMERVLAKCGDERLVSRAFFAQANLLCGGVLGILQPFSERMKEFYDRSGRA